MKKWKVLVAGNDGKKFFLHYHVIAATPEAAKAALAEHLIATRSACDIKECEELEPAEFFLPGVVYKSGKAYFA